MGNALVKVDVQLGRLVFAAHHEWLLQSLEELSIQVLAPFTKVLPHQLIQNLDHLAIGVNYLFVAVRLRHEVGLLKQLEGKEKGPKRKKSKKEGSPKS